MEVPLQTLDGFVPQEHTILIVDDDPINLKILTEYLEEFGFKTLAGRTGESGLERARLSQPDLILLDILLPNIDGFETCRRLKADTVTQDIPVIFMTGLTETEYRLKGFQIGGVDYITKPVEEEEVLARIITHLRLRELTQRLEEKVRERTRELRQTNQQLEQEIAERKRVEEELRREKALLDMLMDNTPDTSIYFKDRQSRLVKINRKMMTDLKMDDPSQAVGQTDIELFGAEFGRQTLALEQKVMSTGEAVIGLIESRATADGRVNWTLTSKVPWRNSDGEIIGIFGLTREINELIQAEQKRRESEEKFRHIVEAIPMGMHMYQLDADGRLIFNGANPAADQILGVDNSQFIGKSIEEAFPPLTETEVPTRYRQVAISGATWHTEQITYNDNQISGCFDVYAFQTAPGKMTAAFLEVTQQKQVEAELRESRQMLELVLDNIPQYICWKDRNSVFLGCNMNYARMVGLPNPEAIVGKTDWDLPWKKEETEFFLAHDRQVMETDTPELHIIEPALGAQGRQTWLDTNKVPLHNAAGQVTGVLVAFEDITERKHAEQALQTQQEADREFSQQLAKLHEVSLKLSLAASWDGLCRQAIECGRELLGFDRMGIWFIDPQDPAYMLGTFGVDEQGQVRDEHNSRILIQLDTAWGELLTGGSPVHYLVDTELTDDRSKLVGHGEKVLAALWDGTKSIGMIAADNLLSKQPITERTRDLLALFAQIVGHLSTLKRTEEELQAQRAAERRFSQQLAQLHEVGLELSLADSFDSLCRQAVELGHSLLEFDRMGIWFVDPQDPAYILGTFGIDEQGQLRDERHQRLLIQPDTGGKLLKGEFPISYQVEEGLTNDKRDIIGRGEKIMVALWDGKKTIGMIGADNLLTGQTISERQRDLLILFGQIVGHLSTLKRAEQALRESEERFSQFMDYLPAIVFIKDQDSRTLYINKHMQDLFDLHDWTGKRTDELFPAKIAAAMIADDQETLRTGYRRVSEKVTDKNGTERTYQTHKFVINRQGTSPLLGGIAIDITEQIRAEAEILRLQHLLQNITNSMPSALIALNPDGEIMLWNPAAEALTNQNAVTVQGQLFWQVCPQFERYRDLFEQVMRERQVAHRHREILKRESEYIYLDVDIFPLIANDLEGVVLRFDDITPRVHLEEVMLQSAKMASVGGLAAGVAHEINNPLGAIMQSAQMLQIAFDTSRPRTRANLQMMGLDSDKLDRYLREKGLLEYLDGIRTTGTRAAKIVSDLLSFSRKTTSDMAPHDLNTLIEQTLALAATDYDLKKQYDFRNIEIIRDFTSNLPLVTCDGPQIQQVLLNLLRNAAQAIAEKRVAKQAEKGQLTLRTSLESEQNTTAVRLEVEDNGPGIPRSVQERLFEPFYTTKEVGEGSGLGLWLCWSIVVERHKGRIWAESIETGGSRFVVELPALSSQS